MEYGYYLLDSRYFVNMDVFERDTFTTTLHELTHLSITQQSKYGMFVYILNRINAIDNDFNSLNNFFVEHMKKMQEGCCTFAEILLITFSRGKAGLDKEVAKLRNDNKEYYNFVKSFLDLLEYVAVNQNTSEQLLFSFSDMYKMIIQLAVCSCDIDVTGIGEDFFQNNKTKKSSNITIDSNISYLYLPDSRFKRALGELKKELNNRKGEEFSASIIDSILHSVCYNLDFKLPVVDEATKAMTYKDSLYRYKEFIKKIYRNSANYDLICKLIAAIDIKLISTDRLLGYSIPESSNSMYTFNLQRYEIKDFCLLNNYIYFIAGDKKTLKSVLTEPNLSKNCILDKIPSRLPNNVSVDAMMSKIRNLKVPFKGIFVFGYDYNNKMISICAIDDNKGKIISFLDKISVPVVVNYNYYRKFKNFIPNHFGEIFVYCDRTYDNSIDLINSFSKNGLPLSFGVIDFTRNNYKTSFSVLIVKINESHYFFLPVVRSTLLLVALDQAKGTLNVIPDLKIEQPFIDKINSIINCIYYY